MNTAEPTQSTKAPASAKSGANEMNYASKSVARHLVRGVIGFGLIVGSIAMVPVAGPVTLVAAPLGLVALRGCPTCWAVGLAQTISRGRLERTCVDGVCTLTKADPGKKAGDAPIAGITVPGDSPVTISPAGDSERAKV